jgi:hypothetical protein
MPGETDATTAAKKQEAFAMWGPGASRWSMDDHSSVMSDWQRVLDW